MSLEFTHADDLARQAGKPDYFTGAVTVQPVAAHEAAQFQAARVTFAAGARTHWHTHAGPQVLYFLAGRGRGHLRAERAVDAAPGAVARIPPGIEHWHGPHPDGRQAMTHLALTSADPTCL